MSALTTTATSAYTLTEHGYGFSVYPAVELQVTETVYRDGVEVSQVTRPLSAVLPGYKPSTFDAEYCGDNLWTIDADCGLQRWRGPKNTREVRKALRTCGFDRNTIERLMRRYRKD